MNETTLFSTNLNKNTVNNIGRFSPDLYQKSGNEGKEANPDYIISAQMRNLSSSALTETTAILIARNSVERDKLLKLIDAANKRTFALNNVTNLNIPQVSKPFFIDWSVQNETVDVRKSIKLNGINNVREFFDRPKDSVQFLQLVDHGVTVIESFKKVFPNNYPFDTAILARQAELVDSLYKKTAYLDLINRAMAENPDFELPPHLPTAVISEDEFAEINNFSDFKKYFESKTNSSAQSFFVKSNLDTGGEVAGELNEENFLINKNKLICDIKDKKRPVKIDLIIQPLIIPPAPEDRNGLPVGVGITAFREANGEIRVLSIMGQINSEPTTNYLGSYFDKELEARILKMVGEEKIKNIFRMLPKDYVGPVATDLMLNADCEYVAVGDLNPRMPASFIALTWKDYLEKEEIEINQIANLGYRGRAVFEDYAELLDFLTRKGWLFTKDNPKGIIPQPSCVRADGVDLIFVNCNIDKIREMTQELEKEMVEKNFTKYPEEENIALYL